MNINFCLSWTQTWLGLASDEAAALLPNVFSTGGVASGGLFFSVWTFFSIGLDTRDLVSFVSSFLLTHNIAS